MDSQSSKQTDTRKRESTDLVRVGDMYATSETIALLRSIANAEDELADVPQSEHDRAKEFIAARHFANWKGSTCFRTYRAYLLDRAGWRPGRESVPWWRALRSVEQWELATTSGSRHESVIKKIERTIVHLRITMPAMAESAGMLSTHTGELWPSKKWRGWSLNRVLLAITEQRESADRVIAEVTDRAIERLRAGDRDGWRSDLEREEDIERRLAGFNRVVRLAGFEKIFSAGGYISRDSSVTGHYTPADGSGRVRLRARTDPGAGRNQNAVLATASEQTAACG